MNSASFLEVSALVRYWDDAKLNGVPDEEGQIPLRNGELWEPVIELATGHVLDWPLGTVARVHYKVCDSGLYWLLDAERRRIASWKRAYVPAAILSRDSAQLSDYIVLHINEEGHIEGWAPPCLDDDEWAPVA